MTLPKSIGIKLYDDSFVPVLTEGETKNKRVVLTTGKDNQKKAVIEIYEGTSAKCSENEYLGKLSIELDRSTNKGEPTFEVNLRLDDKGVLYVKAWDQESKKESELVIENVESNRITQENLTDEEILEYEDTQVQELASQVIDVDERYQDHHVDSLQYENTSYKNANIYDDDDDSGKKRIILGIIIAVLLIGIIILILLCSRSCSSKENVSAVTQKTVSTQITEPSEPNLVDIKEPEREVPAPQPEAEPEKPAEDIAEKKEEPAGLNVLEGQKHYIRYGDNLWNICKRYYGDPWYYPDLAKQNNIAVPRRIYAGKYIIIPQKSKVQRWDFSK